MATMVMTRISLPTSIGYAVKEMSNDVGPGDDVRIDNNINKLQQQQEANDEAYKQSMLRAAAEETTPSNMKSSFKAVLLGSNGPHAPEAQTVNSGAELPNGNNDNHDQEDENSDLAFDSTSKGHSEADSQEKLEFLPLSESQELASGFTGHSLNTSHAAEDPSYIPITTNTTAKLIPSRPASPYTPGQDVRINNVQMNPQSGGETTVSTTNFGSASFQSSKGQLQEYHTMRTSTSHPQSQFLLTISQSGHSEAGLSSFQHQSSQTGEAPPVVKDACQLPECVMSRVSAGMSCAASGGAQLEHLLARVKHEKTMSQARAWEEGAKSKAYNRYTRDESKITAWENTMKSKAEAHMRKAQEKLDKQRAKYIEKMKNAVASAHCKAQERRAAMEAQKAEEIVKAEEISSRIRATGKMPRRCLCLHF